ncbi:MAG TPA: hypothetical protein VGC22_07305, partial [Chitinophaga sp.]
WTRGLMIGGGLAGTALNTTDLDLWVLAHGGHPGNRAEGNVHCILVLNKTEVGIQGLMNTHNSITNFLIGRQVYFKDRFTSYLELSGGSLHAVYKGVVPSGYTPTADEEGKTMFLRSKPFLLGLTSRNVVSYINRRGYDLLHVSIILAANYMPGVQNWKYGYEVKKEGGSYDGGTTTYDEFHGRRVNGVPAYGRFMFTAGIAIGLGGPVVDSYPRFAGRDGCW